MDKAPGVVLLRVSVILQSFQYFNNLAKYPWVYCAIANKELVF